MTFLYLKSLHIIFIVTWFAGMFYIPRLFIYAREAEAQPEGAREVLRHQFRIMARRLWLGITWPSAIITLILGTAMLWNQPQWLQLPFMWLKLTLVALLYVYHLSLHFIYRKQQQDVYPYTSQQLRIWNEVATVFLFSIVFLIVLKDEFHFLWGLAGLALLMAVLFLGIRIYKTLRK